VAGGTVRTGRLLKHEEHEEKKKITKKNEEEAFGHRCFGTDARPR
jgi:hypothetical protein